MHTQSAYLAVAHTESGPTVAYLTIIINHVFLSFKKLTRSLWNMVYTMECFQILTLVTPLLHVLYCMFIWIWCVAAGKQLKHAGQGVGTCTGKHSPMCLLHMTKSKMCWYPKNDLLWLHMIYFRTCISSYYDCPLPPYMLFTSPYSEELVCYGKQCCHCTQLGLHNTIFIP